MSKPDEINKAARELGRRGGLKGGNVRANALSAERRSEIARSGGVARSAKQKGIENIEDLPIAECTGIVKIGEIELPCAVLEDGTRVFTQGGFLNALGRSERPAGRRGDAVEQMPAFLAAKNLKPYISEELIDSSRPIMFRTKPSSQQSEGARGGTIALGYKVELLPRVCNVYLQARDADALMTSEQHGQMRIAARCDILIRGLADVGIIALVDEATGYQEIRAKDALAKILEAFIAKELQAYIDAFPRDFYQEMFRLRGLEYPRDSVKRPQYFGYLTNDIIYKRLAPGVLDELKRITPREPKSGRLKHKYYQRLTSNIGYPKLKEHLGAVVAIMKLSSDWIDFMDKLDRLYPRFGDTIKMAFGDFDPGEDTGSGL